MRDDSYLAQEFEDAAEGVRLIYGLTWLHAAALLRDVATEWEANAENDNDSGRRS